MLLEESKKYANHTRTDVETTEVVQDDPSALKASSIAESMDNEKTVVKTSDLITLPMFFRWKIKEFTDPTWSPPQ